MLDKMLYDESTVFIGPLVEVEDMLTSWEPFEVECSL